MGKSQTTEYPPHPNNPAYCVHGYHMFSNPCPRCQPQMADLYSILMDLRAWVADTMDSDGKIRADALDDYLATLTDEMDGTNRSDQSQKILPCPFCGQSPEITKHFREEMWRLLHRCEAVGPITVPDEIIVTDAMIEAAERVWYEGVRYKIGTGMLVAIYRAMRAAEPHQPQRQARQTTPLAP